MLYAGQIQAGDAGDPVGDRRPCVDRGDLVVGNLGDLSRRRIDAALGDLVEEGTERGIGVGAEVLAVAEDRGPLHHPANVLRQPNRASVALLRLIRSIGQLFLRHEENRDHSHYPFRGNRFRDSGTSD